MGWGFLLASLYAQYIKERLNKNIIETEDAFVVYSYENDHVYIEDIYVIPEHRKSGIASILANMIADEAKEKGIKKMLGSVVPSANGSTSSVKVLLAYGMKVKSSINDFIVFEKEL